MRRVSIVIAVCVIFAVALTVVGQAQRDSDAIMKEVGKLVQGLNPKVQAGDAPGVAADAAKLQALFAETQAFFTKEKMQKAADMAKAAADQADAAAKAAKGGTVDKAVKNLGINCTGCHNEYRIQNPDKSYSLKKQ